MWIRSGLYLGAPKPGEEANFVTGLNDDLLPLMRTLPGVEGAVVLWPAPGEGNGIFCQIILQFADHDAMARMLDAPERDLVRQKRDALLAHFGGIVAHVEYETL